MADFFFYGTLCHAPLLAEVMGREIALAPARLADHATYWVAGHAFPMIKAEPGGMAEGVLARGITDEEAARLDYYEGGFAYATQQVPVGIGAGETVAARIYFPEPSRQTPGAPWDLSVWQARVGDAAVIAARRFMAGFGRVPQAEAMARYPSLLAAAASAVRARKSAPATLRRQAAPGDVEITARAEPYARFFAVEEYDLRHRRFDGAMSGEMHRAVFVSCDAACALPYDPVRDEVLLIEQFRPGPMARGDAEPWMLEGVAGRVDPGETPEEAIRREAGEEAGITLGALYPVAGYYPTPGTMSEYLYAYVGIADLGTVATGTAGLAEEHEDIQSHILPFARLMELVASGEVENGVLLIMAYWLQANRARLRAEIGAGASAAARAGG